MHIEGEDWHLLLDMPGFENDARPPEGGCALLNKTNGSTGTMATVPARRVEGADTAESCRRYSLEKIDRTRQAVARDLGQ